MKTHRLIVFCLLVAGASLAASPQADTQKSPVPAGVSAARESMAKRRALVDDFKQSLDAAQTSEEKRKVMETFREQNQTLMAAQQKAAPVQSKSSADVIAEMKATGNPEMMQRAADLEQRMREVETIKAKLQAIKDATPEQRPQLMKEFQQARAAAAQQRHQQARMGASTPVNRAALPPEVQARMAQRDQRLQELQTLKENLKTANPQDRQKLIEAWHQKQQQDMARQAVLPISPNAASPGNSNRHPTAIPDP